MAENAKNKKEKNLLDDLTNLDELIPEEDDEKDKKEEKPIIKAKFDFKKIKVGLQKIKNEVTQLINIIDETDLGANLIDVDLFHEDSSPIKPEIKIGKSGEKIIEGVFDGQNMVGPDGKVYSVPANYASKSKLVEGDILKLTILADGSFVFKQIGPVERDRLVGQLIFNETKSQYYVILGDQKWKVLTASVTYYKGEAGDEVVILAPKDCKSRWAAVENIIKKSHQI